MPLAVQQTSLSYTHFQSFPIALLIARRDATWLVACLHCIFCLLYTTTRRVTTTAAVTAAYALTTTHGTVVRSPRTRTRTC
jgi:hypothetical protein